MDQPHRYYDHDWRVGDVGVWDNRRGNHMRIRISPGERRLLYRVWIAGSARR